MPIVQGFDPVGALGAAAILAGQGTYARYLQQQQHEAAMQNQRLQSQSDLQRAQLAAEAQRQQAAFGQQSAMSDQEFGQKQTLSDMGQTNELERMRAGQGYSLERLGKEHEYDVDRAHQAMLDKGTWLTTEYDAADEHEKRKLDAAEANLRASSDFTPEEKADGLRQIQEKRAGLNPKQRIVDIGQWFSNGAHQTQLPDGSTVLQYPNGNTDKIRAAAKPKEGADKFNDPRVLHSIIKDVEREVINEGAIDPATDPEGFQAEVDARTGRRLNTMKKYAGRDVPDQAPQKPQFNPDAATWTPEMTSAAMDAIRNPINAGGNLDAAANAAAEDVFNAKHGIKPERSVSTPQPAPRGIPDENPSPAPTVDPIDRAYPPDVAPHIHAELNAAVDAVESAKQSGDKAAVANARATLKALWERYMPQNSAGEAITPPQAPIDPVQDAISKLRQRSAPIIPPPPAGGSRNTMTARGRTISQSR
jgi:hypothetical protein